MNDPIFFVVDLAILSVVVYIVHLLRCIERNTRKGNKDLFQK